MAAVLLPLQARAQGTAANTTGASAPTAPAPARTSPDTGQTRIISDPLYLPLRGQVYGVTGYTFDRPTGQNFRNGSETSTFTADDHSFDQTFAYGLTNNVTIRMAFGYGVNERDSTAMSTGDVTVGNSRGFSDPTFSATYRLLDQPSAPLIFDITGSYSPDVIASTASGGVGEGSIGRGGQNAGLGVAFGRVMDAFTIAGTVGATYVGAQSTTQLASATSTSSDAHWSYAVGLATQTRVTSRVSLDAGVTVGSAASYVVTNIDTLNSHTYAPPVTRTLNLAFNYQLSPNHVVAAVTYAYSNNTDATNTFDKATSDTAVKDRMGNSVGFRVLYAFR
jgi:hypothetical protein